MKPAYMILLAAIAMVIILSIASVAVAVPVSDNAKAPKHDLVRVNFIHYAKPHGGGSAKLPTCYKLMGVKWPSLPVSYVINPTNPQGLSASFVTSSISTSAETWDAATTKELFNNVYSIDYAAQYGVLDNKNTIAFGDYPDSSVIAVTSVWYTRVGKRIVEFDMLFNTDFAWGDATLSSGVMDLQNIATHELGHSVGMDDIYSTSCTAVTMYGYSNHGEISKRTLEQPDITGLQKMYGV